MDGGGAAWMCSCLKESGLRERPGTSGEEGTLPHRDRPVQERARSGGRTLHATEDRILRQAEKESSCGQEMGHRR